MTPSDRASPWLGGLHGASLSALLVSQPILDLVARHPAFLDAHQLGAAGIVALAVLATLVPALLCAPPAAWLARRWPLPGPLRLGLTFLAPALVLVPAVFLAHPNIRSRLRAPVAEAPVVVKNPAPVVFLVLDELPLRILLDSAGRIDARRFPHFARLAASSHWFAGAVSPYATTLPSVPALLTGRYADQELVVQRAETCNLFTDLAGAYSLDVEERVTRLARGIHRPGRVRTAPSSPVRVIARDLGILYLHRLLPTSWAGRLPPVDAAWGSFGNVASEAETGQDPRVGSFLAFIDRLRSPSGVPSLNFFHADLPHRPWTLGGDLVEQTRAVDRLLGLLLERLDELNLLDPALLVVVADHGIGLTPGAGERGDPDRRVVFEEILSVPLFIQLPLQAEGHMHAGYVETVDLVPTLAERLGFRPSCPADGRSLFAPTRDWNETTFYRHRGWQEPPRVGIEIRPAGPEDR